ncbi:hypothetical protein ACHAXR_000806, partial [Thalassiosira sp. AJA248-18]
SVPTATPRTSNCGRPSTTQSRPHPRPPSTSAVSKPAATKPTPSSSQLLHHWERKSQPSAADTVKHSALIDYNKKYRGIVSANDGPMAGVRCQDPSDVPKWKKHLPSRSSLHDRKRFGRPSRYHSVTQEACFETCLFPILMSGYLGFCEFSALCNTHSVIPHLVKMMVKLQNHDFRWLAYDDPHWKAQQTVPQSHAMAILAALFHYRMHAADVMRYLGGTYTGEHRDIDGAVACLVDHNIDPCLIAEYVRAMTVGCPNHMVAETSRENFLLHWRKGNHPSVNKYLVEVLNTIAKEHRNRFNMPLPNYMARFLPHCFITPQHALKKLHKAMRLIFDGSK